METAALPGDRTITVIGSNEHGSIGPTFLASGLESNNYNISLVVRIFDGLESYVSVNSLFVQVAVT